LPEPEISSIVLCYRAGESIRAVIDPLHEQLSAAGAPFELILVANYWPGQDDDTPQVAERFASEHDNVVVVAREKEGAMGWDMRTGLDAARGDYILVIDGDAQNPVEDVLAMYSTMKSTGVDLMKGRRTLRHDGFKRRVISIVYNILFKAMFRTRGLWDINGKPKGLRRDAYQRMSLTSDDWFIDAEIVLAARRADMSIREMPVVFRTLDERPSFVRLSAIGEFLANMFRARFRR
jgi:glycosyltransferase involved in cell wall biosynthesis